MSKIKILNKLEYQTYPIVDGMIDIDDDLLKEIGNTKCFDIKTNKIIDYTPTAEDTKPRDIATRIDRLTELTKDLAQVQAGLIIDNIEEKKAEFRTLLNEVRILQGKEPRECEN